MKTLIIGLMKIFRLINFYNPSEIIIHTENYDIDLNYINNKCK